jgi:hypothetical protein
MPEDFRPFLRYDLVDQLANVRRLNFQKSFGVLDASLSERKGIHQDLDFRVHDTGQRIPLSVLSRSERPVLDEEECHLFALGGEVPSEAIEIGNVATLEWVSRFNQDISRHRSLPKMR